jgi:hypothetical protein
MAELFLTNGERKIVYPRRSKFSHYEIARFMQTENYIISRIMLNDDEPRQVIIMEKGGAPVHIGSRVGDGAVRQEVANVEVVNMELPLNYAFSQLLGVERRGNVMLTWEYCLQSALLLSTVDTYPTSRVVEML